ncbi:adenosine kinase-like isoform X2 [Mizuhopecten yessoensis]|uniref:Adenosine kinase n=1 Tax=Mizuhopecten yessoensis TaxID=6573 RepID=A0A210PMV3_MIZYE|nr:adenosine kinase-like isoform X2 [Mizuhopecten yessoensis]OWF37829.1 Adenosine kinase [Mizuhopecten yessoensis]
MAKEGCLLGYGNPLLDISVQGTAEFLEKYELKADNAILAEEKHKGMYDDMTETFKDSVEYVPGGATLNSIRIAQWLTGVPQATTFFGCINEDKYGNILLKKATDDNVNFKCQITKKAPTGTCAVIVTDTSRSLCANLGAANLFTKDHLDVKENWNLVEEAQYYYIAGFPLTACPAAVEMIAKHSSEKGKTFATNLSAPFICQFFKEPMMQVMPYVDILFGNETEADTFAKEHKFGTEDRKEIAKKMAALPKENKDKPRIVVITQGEDPVIVVKDGEVTEYPVIPIKSKDIIDTNGAGDAFVGGYLAELVKGENEAKCVKCGNYAANIVIQRSGCTFPAEPDFE